MRPVTRRGGEVRAPAPPAKAGEVRRAALAAALLVAAVAPPARADEPEDHWEQGEARAFASARADVGTVQHLCLAAGWGQPHWMWGGLEAHGVLGFDFASASADLRLALLVADLSAGLRATQTFRHLPLPDVPSQDGLLKGGGFAYRTLDLFASGVVPTPGGLALWEVNAVRFLDAPAGSQIYEEWLRAVCAPPWCGVARLAWAARLRQGALYLGAGAEWAFLDGRGGPDLVRVGPVASWRLWPHLSLQGAVYLPVSDPDRLALLASVNAVVTLGWTFATGDTPPRFP